jgi:hypothetical protein
LEALGADRTTSESLSVAGEIQEIYRTLSGFVENNSLPVLPVGNKGWGTFITSSINYGQELFEAARDVVNPLANICLLLTDKDDYNGSIKKISAGATSDLLALITTASDNKEILNGVVSDADIKTLNKVDSMIATTGLARSINSEAALWKLEQAIEIYKGLTVASPVAVNGDIQSYDLATWLLDMGEHDIAAIRTQDQPTTAISTPTSALHAQSYTGTVDGLHDIGVPYTLPSTNTYPSVSFTAPGSGLDNVKSDCYNWKARMNFFIILSDATDITAYGGPITVTLAMGSCDNDGVSAPTNWSQRTTFEIPTTGSGATDAVTASIYLEQDVNPGQIVYWDLDLSSITQPGTVLTATVSMNSVKFIGRPKQTTSCPVTSVTYYSSGSLHTVGLKDKWINYMGIVERWDLEDPNYSVTQLWKQRISGNIALAHDVVASLYQYANDTFTTMASIDTKYDDLKVTGGMLGVANASQWIYDDGPFKDVDSDDDIYSAIKYLIDDLVFLRDNWGVASDMTLAVIKGNAREESV